MARVGIVTPIGTAIPSLTITTAVSQIVPGVTSLSLRNNANTLDNLIVTDAGAVAVRAGFGANGKAAQGAVVAGAAAPAGGVGAAAGGWSLAADRDTAIAMINQIRTALIANGIMA